MEKPISTDMPKLGPAWKNCGKLLQLIAVAWPEHSVNETRRLLGRTDELLKKTIEERVKEKEEEMAAMTIKSLNQTLEL